MELPKDIQQIKNKFLLVSIWSQDAYPLTLLKTFKFEFMHEFMNTFMFFWLKKQSLQMHIQEVVIHTKDGYFILNFYAIHFPGRVRCCTLFFPLPFYLTITL